MAFPPADATGNSASTSNVGRGLRGPVDRGLYATEIAVHLEAQRSRPWRAEERALEAVVDALDHAAADTRPVAGLGEDGDRLARRLWSAGTMRRPVTDPSGWTVASSAQLLSP